MRKALGLMAVFLMFTASTMAVSVTGLKISPSKPQLNDSVNITADIDAQGDYIQRTTLTVMRNNTELSNGDMSLLSGHRYSQATYQKLNAFGLNKEPATYYITATAVTSNGKTDSQSLVIEVKDNNTVVKNPNKNTRTKRFLGIGIDGIVVILIVLGLLVAVLGDY